MICVHCGQSIAKVRGRWVDGHAGVVGMVWREICPASDGFGAEHEPITEEDAKFLRKVEG